MKVERIHLRRFRTHADTELTFPEEGIVGLVGQNESGKSTLAIEALLWALFGSRALRGSVGSIRWHGAPARKIAEVTLDFEVGGTAYRIERSENDATLRERDGRILAESISGVDGAVPRVVGMDLDESESSYFASQKDLQRLDQMGGTAKRQFVLGLMGLGRIDEAIEACRARKNELKNEVQGLREGLGERDPIEAEVTEAEEELADVTDRIEDRLSPQAADAGEALSETTEKVEASRERKERHDDLTRQRTEARSQAREAGEEMERAEAKLEAAREAARELEERRPEIEPLADLREEREALVEARARAKERRTLESLVETRTEELEQLRSVEQEAAERVDAHADVDPHPRAALEMAEEDLAASRKRLEELSDHDKVAALRSRLEPGHDCPVCEQRVEDVPAASEAEEELRQAREAVREDTERRDRCRERVEALERHKTKLTEVREKIESKEADLSEARQRLEDSDVPTFDATRLAQVEGEIERLEAVEKELRQLKARADRIPELEPEVERWSEKATSAKERELEATEALEALDFDADAHGALEKGLEERREAAQEASRALSRAQTRREAAAERVERAREQLAAYEERAEHVRETEGAWRVHVQTDERLTAFRAAEASSIRPELEELVSGFLGVLTDGRHEAATLTEDFDLNVYEAGDYQEVISGGAEDVASIALRLAISQLVSERAGHPLSLLVLDEPFGSLDAARRGNVVRLIRELRGVFSQIVLISHIEEVQDAVDVAYVVEFDESEGKSNLTRSDNPRMVEEVA